MDSIRFPWPFKVIDGVRIDFVATAFDVEAIAMPRHSEVANYGEGILGMCLQHMRELSWCTIGLTLIFIFRILDEYFA
jgi:hypothetical protein